MLVRVKIEAEILLPVGLHRLCAGFPSPADDFLDEAIDLTRLLVRNPPATFLWKVDGSSMIDAGIYDGDLLLVERSLTPRHRDGGESVQSWDFGPFKERTVNAASGR